MFPVGIACRQKRRWETPEMDEKTAVCPKCGTRLRLLLPSDGKGARTLRCVNCADDDPLKDHRADGWVKSLKPPE
jgi:tRNA(Ile2) C34 agmatinyltransferase TiaS